MVVDPGGIIDVDVADENVDGPFRPLTLAACDAGDGMCRDRELDVRLIVAAVPCVCGDVDRERPRFVFGEHTEHESSVQLTELFDIDLVA